MHRLSPYHVNLLSTCYNSLMRTSTKALGFTLIELLVTIALVAVLLSLAAPNLSKFMARNNAEAATSRLSAIFAYARSEAIVRASNVWVCASTDGAACAVNDDTAWNDRWLVRTLTTAGTILKAEDIRGLGLSFAVTNQAGANRDTVASICFNSVGEMCNPLAVGDSFYQFTATAPAFPDGEIPSSTQIIFPSGAVGL